MELTRIAITGHEGFIGSNLIKFISNTAPNTDYIRVSLGHFPPYSIEDVQKQLSENKADMVVHLAAIAGVNECRNYPEEAFKSNITLTHKILEAMRRMGTSAPIVFASSGAAESSENLYGATKRASEELIKAYNREYGINAVILRLGNVYGPYSMHKNSFVHVAIRNILQHKEIVIHGNGTQRRRFVFVSDVCRAILQTGKIVNPSIVPVLNICPRTLLPIYNIVEILEKTSGESPIVSFDPDASPGTLLQDSDCFNNYPMEYTKIQEGLIKTLAWYKKELALTQKGM
jgi:nucleoside-diphosphate-sugar epimerase